VFWPDAGIDTGPILLQRSASVGPDDTAGSLYYGTLFALGVDVVVDAVALIAAGNPPRVPQDAAAGTYDPLLTDAHAAVDWTASTARVHDLIRGCDPQPGAHTRVGASRVRVFEPRRVAAATGRPPGTVVAIETQDVTIATADGAVRCARARGDGPKTAAADVFRALGVAEGTRLGV
jgi:methionyl-tRNA formyltransferase